MPIQSLKNSIKFFSFALILLGLSTQISHAGESYDIELLIYKYSDVSAQFSSEQWPQRWRIPTDDEAINLTHIPNKYKDKFRRLAGSEHKFNGILKSIEDSNRFEKLAYLSWRQPGLDKINAISININSGHVYIQETMTNNSIDENTGSLFLNSSQLYPQESAVSESSSTEPLTVKYRVADKDNFPAADKRIYELSGNVKIVLSRFLHIYTDFLLMQPVSIKQTRVKTNNSSLISNAEAAVFEPTETKYLVTIIDEREPFTTLHGFNIKAHRRMRSSELHFIDHPLVGIIVQATPVKK